VRPAKNPRRGIGHETSVRFTRFARRSIHRSRQYAYAVHDRRLQPTPIVAGALGLLSCRLPYQRARCASHIQTALECRPLRATSASITPRVSMRRRRRQRPSMRHTERRRALGARVAQIVPDSIVLWCVSEASSRANAEDPPYSSKGSESSRADAGGATDETCLRAAHRSARLTPSRYASPDVTCAA